MIGAPLAWSQRQRTRIEPNVPYDGKFTFARIRYTQGYRMAWSADYPQMERNFTTILDDFYFQQQWDVFEQGMRMVLPDAQIMPLDRGDQLQQRHRRLHGVVRRGMVSGQPVERCVQVCDEPCHLRIVAVAKRCGRCSP